MILDRDTLTQLARRGWCPGLEPDKLMKMYTGYIGVVEQVGSEVTPPKQRNGKPGGPPRYTWAVWSTGPRPVRKGNEPDAIRAARRVDKAISMLNREGVSYRVPQTV